MNSLPTEQSARIGLKARELGINEDMMACALNFITSNRNLVNAIDHRMEMDDYIYQAIIRQACQQRKQKAEADLYSSDTNRQVQASDELSVMSREELVTDPYFRAVLPLLIKVMNGAPILKLHAEEASAIVMQLAECKRKNRATSFTEVIVKRCSAEIGVEN